MAQIEPKRLLIVYHSMTGGTLQMAQAAEQGATCEPAIQVVLLPAAAAQARDLLAAHGFIFASPENLGAMSGMLKDFFDRTYYSALDQLNGRPYCSLICAGSDGSQAARQIERIALGWRLRQVAPPLIVSTYAQSPAAILRQKIIAAEDLVRCRELGSTLAAGMSLGIY